ncbi:hypothetical protein AUK22_05820 [bacterium CG2_30_54_10]|nr:MAG: hypothetical protein AUK22_05820 [bacterium CG2_30_54_10]
MRKNSHQRKGGFSPLKSTVTQCVAIFRNKQHANRDQNSNSGNWLPEDVSACDMVALGRLAYSWEQIAGRDLRRFVYPSRLARGKLTVICADSQWFQTLTYLKPSIHANLRRLFPDLQISSIDGRLGTIPVAVQREPVEVWPDWNQEGTIDLPDIGNPDLTNTIQTCRKKLQARLKGLTTKGYHLCGKCGFNLIPSGVEACSICTFKAREQDLAKTRSLLNETPWISFDEVKKLVAGLAQLEFDAIRSELLGEALNRIRIFGADLKESFNLGDYLKMRYEMFRAVIFQTGIMPNLVDLDDSSGKFLLDPSWKEFLALGIEEEVC